MDLDALLALGSLVHPDPSASSRESGAGSPGGALDEKALRHLRGVARVNSSAPATPSASGAHARGSLDTMPQRVYSQSERGGSPLSAKERALSYDEAAGARAGGRAHSVSGIDMGPQPSHASVTPHPSTLVTLPACFPTSSAGWIEGSGRGGLRIQPSTPSPQNARSCLIRRMFVIRRDHPMPPVHV